MSTPAPAIIPSVTVSSRAALCQVWEAIGTGPLGAQDLRTEGVEECLFGNPPRLLSWRRGWRGPPAPGQPRLAARTGATATTGTATVMAGTVTATATATAIGTATATAGAGMGITAGAAMGTTRTPTHTTGTPSSTSASPPPTTST